MTKRRLTTDTHYPSPNAARALAHAATNLCPNPACPLLLSPPPPSPSTPSSPTARRATSPPNPPKPSKTPKPLNCLNRLLPNKNPRPAKKSSPPPIIYRLKKPKSVTLGRKPSKSTLSGGRWRTALPDVYTQRKRYRVAWGGAPRHPIGLLASVHIRIVRSCIWPFRAPDVSRRCNLSV